MKLRMISLAVFAVFLLSGITACKHDESSASPAISFEAWVTEMVASDEDGEPLNIDTIVAPNEEQSDAQSFDKLLEM